MVDTKNFNYRKSYETCGVLFSINILVSNLTRAFGGYWDRAFAGLRRERRGFLVAFDGRTSSYRKRQCYTINGRPLISAHTNAENTKLGHY